MTIGTEEFRAALGRFASGVTVVTTKDAAGKLHGITVSAFCSVSLRPPMVLICIEKSTGSHYAFEESGEFVVNILDGNQQSHSEHFASPHLEKFVGIDYTLSASGIPVLSDVLVNLECTIVNNYDGGDHSVYVASVENIQIKDGSPLVYFHGNYRLLTD